MSLIIDCMAEYKGQPHNERPISRLKYSPDGRGKLIYSDGSSLLDTIKHSYEDYYNYHHPFYMLPKGYDKLKNMQTTKFIYKTIKDLLDDYELKPR